MANTLATHIDKADNKAPKILIDSKHPDVGVVKDLKEEQRQAHTGFFD